MPRRIGSIADWRLSPLCNVRGDLLLTAVAWQSIESGNKRMSTCTQMGELVEWRRHIEWALTINEHVGSQDRLRTTRRLVTLKSILGFQSLAQRPSSCKTDAHSCGMLARQCSKGHHVASR